MSSHPLEGAVPLTIMLRGSKQQPQETLQDEPQDQEQTISLLRSISSSNRNLQVGPQKNPLNPNKDAAERPFDPDTFFKGTDTYQERPSNISYFPDQVFQISYIVSVLDTPESLSRNSNNDNNNNNNNSTFTSVGSNSLYLEDLREALDLLVTELAPSAYPNLWVFAINTSIDGWFRTECPSDTNLKNCHDITSSIGIYLSFFPPFDTSKLENSSIPNLDDAANSRDVSTKKATIDPSTLTAELRTLQLTLEQAVANNRLQEIIESFYDSISAEPPIYVLPIQVSSPPISGGEEGNHGEDDETTTPGEDQNQVEEESTAGQSGSGNVGTGGQSSSNTTDIGTDDIVIEDENDEEDDSGVDTGGQSSSNSTDIDTDDIFIEDENKEEEDDSGSVTGGENTNSGDHQNTTTNINNNTIDEQYDNENDDTSNAPSESSDSDSTPINDADEVTDPEDIVQVGDGGNVGLTDSNNSTTGNTTSPVIAESIGIEETTTVKSSLSLAGIMGIVVIPMAAVLLVVSLLFVRRRSRRRNNENQPSNRYSDSLNKSGSKGDFPTKSLAAELNDDDLKSNDSSNKNNSLGRFLYAGLQRESSYNSRTGTVHSRSTSPTVSASASTMSEHTDRSFSSATEDGSRSAEARKREEYLMPFHTSRALLPLQEEMISEEDGDSDRLLDRSSSKSSDLFLTPTDSLEIEAESGNIVAEMYNGESEDDAYSSHSVESSGWSSIASPSVRESPLKAMAARGISALRRGRRGSRSNSIHRSKKELEEVLSTGLMRVDVEEDRPEEADRVSLPDFDKDADEILKKEAELAAIFSPVVSSNTSQGSAISDIRPLSSLDEAIMNGDWAVVGATAALMAASISPAEKAQNSTSRRSSLNSSSLERPDLDKLIEQGDWQGVMVAAARYDADAVASNSMGEEGSRSARSRTSTQGSDTADGSNYSGMDHSSAYNSGARGSVTTTASQKERIEEIRAQVERMVRDVVPEEAENVDEMMNQFKGKEDELLETLRTMKERDVAKKARLESQKIARRNTRSKEKKDKFFEVSTPETAPDAPPDAPRDAPPDAPPDEPPRDTTCEVVSDSDDDSDSTPKPAVAPSTGSFAQATKKEVDSAAAAAAEWAIERSLSELMEKEQAAATSLIP